MGMISLLSICIHLTSALMIKMSVESVTLSWHTLDSTAVFFKSFHTKAQPKSLLVSGVNVSTWVM